MREFMDKRAIGGLAFSRRGSSLAIRDSNHEDKRISCCNRLGCSTRFYTMGGTQIGNPEKAKQLKTSFRSTSSKSIDGISTKSLHVSSNYRKPHQERRNRTSLLVTADVESINRRGEREGSGSSNRQGETVLHGTEDIEPTVLHGFSENVNETLESTKSSSRTRNHINRRLDSSNQDSSSSSSIRHAIASRNISQANKHASQGAGSGAQRYGLKSFNCTTKSDGFRSGCPSSDSGRNRTADVVQKRSSDGESSAARGKSMTASSNGGYSGSRHRGLSAPNPSPPERLMPQQTSRKSRNRPTSRDDMFSVSTQAPGVETRTGLSEQENDSSLSISTPSMTSELRQTRLPISERGAPGSSSRSFSIEYPHISGSSTRTARIRPISSNTGLVNGPSGGRDGYQHLNMEGITEVLLALERLDQNEELTYEQLLVLETNLSSGGLAFHDQHRDMRLDIDHMSYEELLALEERMGSVSTALTEEALSRCLKRSIYKAPSLGLGITFRGDDDTKCSICQEEYAVGDEVGKLVCEHRYHVACIHRWLRQKNWCPICKASVCSS